MEKVEISAKTGAKKPLEWRLWLLIILFPIAFSPWWLTVICLTLFTVLALVFRETPEST